MAIKQAQNYLNEGYIWAIEIDLEKFFDTVNQDRLMYLLSRRINEKRVLRLIRRFLQSGVQIGSTVEQSLEGMPYGSLMSPILSNILLDELDNELEKRGHKFVRSADDFCIFTKKQRAGERLMSSISSFLLDMLILRVTRDKSRISKPKEIKLLGYAFYWRKGIHRLHIHPTTYKKIKLKIKGITPKT